VLLALACSRPAVPNVLLVTFDTTRADHFGCTGDPEARTPTVDALAARGLLFRQAFASAALTLPSHTTIMTGLEPIVHGVHDNGRFRVPDDLETLAERLHAAGFDTAAFVSAFVLDARFRLNQGFDVYDDRTRPSSSPLDFTVPRRSGAEVTDAALAWLRQRSPERPFFLWAHFYDPHLPRYREPPFDTMPDPYAGGIAYADAQLGRLLVGLADIDDGRETLVVFTADHGEGLGSHGEQTHGVLAYDSTLHVPLVLAGPGVSAGVRSEVLARHTDLVPTILALLGLAVPRELPGRSLVAAAASGTTPDDVVGYFEARGAHYELGWAIIDGVRTARWKYTGTPEPRELFDVAADPGETRNLAAREPAVVATLEDRRAALAAQHAPARARPTRLTREEQERLAALGYVDAPQAHEPGAEPDPRRFASIRDWVDDARVLADAGEYAEAIDALEALAQSPTVRGLVLRTLAPIYAESGRLDDALAAYRDYIALTGAAEASLGVARTLLAAGQPDEALAVLEAVPESPPGHLLQAHALGRLGRHAEARAMVDLAFGTQAERARHHKRAALVIDAAPISDGESELRGLLAASPDDAVLQSWLGYYLALWGRPEDREEAFRLLAEAARREPEHADVQANLGWGAARLGRDADARTALEASLALDPRRALERYRLAIVLARSGDRERATELVRLALRFRPAAPWAGSARELLQDLERPDARAAQVSP
jgi:arylsulfatase A-like enzyme/Tfp pilus assembly protein PilF